MLDADQGVVDATKTLRAAHQQAGEPQPLRRMASGPRSGSAASIENNLQPLATTGIKSLQAFFAKIPTHHTLPAAPGYRNG